ncbi:MAG: type III secretion protein [Acidobacteriia bacterium]|nr:type III secretion protein [Terriglobia bacterium]
MPVDALLARLIESGMLYGFLLTLARMSGALAFLPLAAFKATPEPVRVVLALGFTLMLWPLWKAPKGFPSIGVILSGVLSELALGLAIGVAVAIVLEVFQIAAQMISVQAGFGFASTIDPTSGAESTVLLTLAQILAGLLFFTSGADRMLIHALGDSMYLVPPTMFHLKAHWAEAMIRFSGSIFGLGLRLAAPVIALLLLADTALAVLGRVQSQIQLVSLTMPVKLLATTLLLATGIGVQPRFFDSAMSQCIRFIEGMLRSAR